MTARCKHERVLIREYHEAWTDHDREAEGAWSHNSAAGDYSGELWVRCRDCGRLTTGLNDRERKGERDG